MADATANGSREAAGRLERVADVLSRLSSAKDTGAYTGALSYAAEWHSLALGLGVGFAGSTAARQALVAYAVGRGGGKRIGNSSAHMKDVADEPAYALGGVVVGSALRTGRLSLEAVGGLV